ncbi:MAG: amino acid ABC transporter permease [Acidimicrobiia bacterium]|nr:amino acid ABC transporter permease [Acidimicrobiia bacterium]MYF84167.1 amino acid ABC transporter permease [Acidimicrobiia bacterium]
MKSLLVIPVLAQARFRPEFIWENRDVFLGGVRLTVFIAIVAFALATVFGLGVALLRMSKNRLLAPIMAAYINIFRAIPLLVFVVFVYYGIAIQFDVRISAIQAGILVLTLQYSAWLGEIFRGGIQAVDDGQTQAALSVGMSRPQTFFRVVLPQAIRIVIPPTGNMFIGMIKDSSLVFIIGVPELFRVSSVMANRTFRYFEVYLGAVLFYLILTTAAYFGVKYIEKRFALVDVLTTRVRSPLARRRGIRLRMIQEAVASEREAKSSETGTAM